MKTARRSVISIIATVALTGLAVNWPHSLNAQQSDSEQTCGTKYTSGLATGTKITGSGSGATFNIVVDGNGTITSSSLAAPGVGYGSGDVGGLDGVNGDGTVGFQVDTVSINDPNRLNGTILTYHLVPFFLSLSGIDPSSASDVQSPDAKFQQRAQAATQMNACRPIDVPDKCGNLDRGEDYIAALLGRLAAGGAPQQAAINSLANLQRSSYGLMGTDSSVKGCSLGDQLLGFVENLLSNANRRGDGDVAMIGLVNILYAYGTRGKKVLPQNVYDNVLHQLIDLSPGPGSVESLSFDANPLTVCPSLCAVGIALGPLGYLGCSAACPILVSSQSVDTPETENHINMIYASQYLANQLLFDETSNPMFDNARNGYRAILLNRLNDFTKNDFIEYNSHNYQDYSMFALLALASYADDPKVLTAAQNVVNYISAKVAVSSNDARRSTPFRRHNDPNGDHPIHLCDELVLQECADPQTAYYMMLAGVTGILGNLPDLAACSPSGCLPKNYAPAPFADQFQWAATTTYRIPAPILDLFDNNNDRNFYQFFHYARALQTDGFQDANDELYFSSPSYLLSAGGHSTHNAYTADVTFPLDEVPISLSPLKQLGKHPGKDDDLGVSVATTLMPTGDLHSRAQMIRFDSGLCVGPNFACGLNPVLAYATIPDPMPKAGVPGAWHFADKHGAPNTPGYYVAVYQQDNFGFLEVYDTWKNTKGVADINDFISRVHANNDTQVYAGTGNNTETTIEGDVIQFTLDPRIVSINGNPPYDPTRTNGTIINNNGAGIITITNPAMPNAALTLDATRPPNSPLISIPGPLSFPDTCVGATNSTTLDICNAGTGDNLFTYNILSPNKQFQVTEPTSGYPTTISANFCYPFQATFAPIMTGPISGKLTISNSDPTQPELKLAVSGNGIQQSIASTISNGGNFGNVCPGSQANLSLNVTNQGGCNLVISKVTSSSGLFLPPTMTLPLTLSPDATISLPITFQPGASQACSNSSPLTGTITIASNDPVTPNLTVNVTAMVPCPSLNATIGNAGSFGNVCSGTQADLNLQIINQGLCNLNISGIASTSAASYDNFVLPAGVTYPLVLSADASVNVPIRFQPPAYGTPNYVTCSSTVPQTASVTITSNDPIHPSYVTPVSGIEGCPQVVLSPKNLNGIYAFPATVSDPTLTLGCFTDRQIAVTNAGICPLTIASLATTNGLDGLGSQLPATPLEFKVINPTVPVTIAPGAAPVPITVRFKPLILTDQNPMAPDQQTGTLNIVSNDPVGSDNTGGLCGEPTFHSGVRVLVVDSLSNPVSSVDKLTLMSKGLTPVFNEGLMPAPLLGPSTVCGNPILYHLDDETLRPAGTTGNNPLASYVLSAKNGSTHADMSFTLDQCQVKQIVLQLQ